MIKWLGKNWLKLIIIIFIIISLIVLDRACQNDENQEKIDEKDKKITELEKKNTGLENDVFSATKTAVKWEKKAKEKEDLLLARQSEIDQLKADLKKVPAIIAELPPPRLVEDMRKILDCAEIELKDNGILFSKKAARIALTELTKFSLVKREVGLIEESQFDCQDALTFQKLATWNVYRIAWSQGSQILNYKTITKEKDQQFSLLKKQKKRSWLDGLWKGFLAGFGAAIAISILIGR